MSQEIVYAQITEILGPMSGNGAVNQCKVKFIGKQDRTIIRNIMGPCRKGDIVVLMESEREARRMK